MRCPFCGNLEDRVVDSREGREGDVIRRRRECARCERRFTSYEKIELPTFQVVKRDQRREPYDRNKLMRGLQIACRKRPVPQPQLEQIADSIESAMSMLMVISLSVRHCSRALQRYGKRSLCIRNRCAPDLRA